MAANMENKTVIKLNNIPHGFYEEQMKKYFSQFGGVKNVLLIRSERTHKSRGFGFVEFYLPQVARAASEAMHNYLLFNNVLKCRQMDRNDLPQKFFKKNYKGLNSVLQTKKDHNVTQRDASKMYEHYKKIVKTQKALKEMGITLKCRIINMPQKETSSPEKSS